MIYTFTEHRDCVRSVAATDNTIISGGEDKLICVWDIATGNCLHKLTRHAGELCAVAISPDGQFAAASSSDNAL